MSQYFIILLGTATYGKRVAEQLIGKCKDVPIHALNVAARNRMGLFLNPECPAMAAEDFLGDYQGLAEVIGFDFQDIKNFQRHHNPTQEVLSQWGTRPELSPTVDNLIRHLQTIGRGDDVITECAHLIEKDVEKYRRSIKPIQSTNGMIRKPSDASYSATLPSGNLLPRVTTDDVKNGDEPLYYDAFVIYSPAGRDLDFVKDLAGKVEGPPHNLKLFIPWRDDLPGSSRHEISAHMIATRCRRVMVILSKNFLKSASADFQLKYAHCLSPGARNMRVIPVVAEPCETPSILKPVTSVDFTNPEMMDWNMPRLLKVLRRPITVDPRDYMSKAKLEELKLSAGNLGARSWWSTGILTMNFPEETLKNCCS